MKIYFRAKNIGFYSEEAHGARTLLIPDPSWVRPTIAFTPADTGIEDVPPEETQIPDMSVSAPWIEVPNPLCTLPPESELVEISEEKYAEIFSGIASEIKEIVSGPDGYPMLKDPDPLTPEQLSLFATTKRDGLLVLSATRIAPLQSAVDLDDATASDIANLKKWKQYQVALNRIQDQPAFPRDIAWPVEPS
jgi:hypothetical protein